MRKIISTVLFLAASMLVAGCAENSADDRVRIMFGIPESQPLTETLVADIGAKRYLTGL